MNFMQYHKISGILVSLFLILSHPFLQTVMAESITCYHSDASGNIVALTDDTGQVVQRFAYCPYGKTLAQDTSLQTPYKFSGIFGIKEELPDLYFMRARYYSADAARFLSTDPVKNIGPGWKYSPYVYANNSPLFFGDPRGEFPSPIKHILNLQIPGLGDATIKVLTYYSLSSERSLYLDLGLEDASLNYNPETHKIYTKHSFDDTERATIPKFGVGVKEKYNFGDFYVGSSAGVGVGSPVDFKVERTGGIVSNFELSVSFKGFGIFVGQDRNSHLEQPEIMGVGGGSGGGRRSSNSNNTVNAGFYGESQNITNNFNVFNPNPQCPADRGGVSSTQEDQSSGGFGSRLWEGTKSVGRWFGKNLNPINWFR